MFKRLKVVYGEPIDIAPYRERRASSEEVTEVIMNEIKKLIDLNKLQK
jgi:1-acyl-sn-glycerol-3-phosphate acyltransferase